MDSERRPRLTPAIADVRRAVRSSFPSLVGNASATGNASLTGSASLTDNASVTENEGVSASRVVETPVGGSLSTETPSFSAEHEPAEHEPVEHEPVGPGPVRRAPGTAALVLVALSGGPDSLALAAATAFEAPRAGLRAGAVIVDHGIQSGSADVAAAAADQAHSLGLDPVLVVRVRVGTSGGPEAAARSARYDALESAARETGAAFILLGHTLDDQAETVLLGLARGSGPASLSGMSAMTASNPSSGMSTSSGSAAGVIFVRPLLGIRRATTVQSCADLALTPWRDPQNDDPAFARVRVRNTVLPMLEKELGPGIADALARTASQLREDSDALDHFAEEIAEELADLAESGISLPVRALASNPPALRQRLIRLAVASEFHVSLSRQHTLEISRLITDWHGQKPLDLPGVRVERQGGLLLFTANE